ncbi:MAG TPA: biopolymer transporter ExbD [Luteolibacter sp.]|nr:biopolymer transporter ExbD [Luteolibacter sp.]
MARHKKQELIPEGDPALDISSLIDVCFLLLIYFITTSTIAPRESDLNMALPGSDPGDTPPKIKPMFISIDETGAIYTGVEPREPMDSDMSSRKLPLLGTRLELYKDGAEAAGEKPLVQIQVNPDAKQQRVIDVLNALAEKDITSVTFTDSLAPDE